MIAIMYIHKYRTNIFTSENKDSLCPVLFWADKQLLLQSPDNSFYYGACYGVYHHLH